MARLTIMGSGELAPGMVRVHRAALAEYENPELVVLDSPYGFQENADELTAKLVDFFETSLVVSPRVASLRRTGEPVAAARVRSAIAEADVVFSGPGSPSYALRVWTDNGLVDSLRVAAVSQSVTFASAAACTLGRWAIPVYEIYKVGEDPHWSDGLDAFQLMGSPTVVVPHFDNREGGTHDTSHCYIGARRFAALRRRLSDHVVVGVDEHTAASFEFGPGRVDVTGRGALHILLGEDHLTFAPGRHDLTNLQLTATALATQQSAAPSPDVDRLLASIVASTGPGDAERDAIRLAEMAEQGGSDPTAAAAPFVELLLDLRSQSRAAGDYATADRIRDGLAAAGVVVRDTPDGARWEIAHSSDRPSS